MPLRKALLPPSSFRNTQKGRSKLCNVCHNLDPRGHSSTVHYTEGVNKVTTSLTLVVDVLLLPKSQCRYCILLTRALNAFLKHWQTSRARLSMEIVEKGTIKLSLNDVRHRGVQLELYNPIDERPAWTTLGTACSIPGNSGSDESFKFARRCIEDCLTNPQHKACIKQGSGPRPKRLIDVGRINQPIKLCEPRGKDVKYVALSHCWGQGRILTATIDNLMAMKLQISWDSLPPLFQDAIIITRQLGMRYIWIDSLCIVQDSKQDWQCESAKMGSIYENSYVTVAAITSDDSASRCLMDRPKPVRLPFTNTKGKVSPVKVRRVLDHHPDANSATPARLSGPLTTRSWALQEHVLCSRILQYTATEIMFECRTAYRCECLPAPQRLPTMPALLPKAISSKKSDSVWSAWQDIVAQYSKRKLTMPLDKLPAISGIASKVQATTKSVYLAGLWADNIASDLLWSSDPSLEHPQRANRVREWRAPSFSWASVDTEIQYYKADEDEEGQLKACVKIIEASCTPAGLNPLGEVVDGFINLQGLVLEVILVSPDPGTFAYQLLRKGFSAIQVAPDSLLVEDDVQITSGKDVHTIRRARPGEEPSPFKSTVLCLKVASSSDEWLSGLVLDLSPTVPGAYERLGTFSSGLEFFQSAPPRNIKLV